MRDRVNFTSNERVDLPDLRASLLNGRLADYYLSRGFIFGPAVTSTNGGHVHGDTHLMTQGYWAISVLGTELTIAAGLAWAGETLADGSIVDGAIVGEDGDASQTLDFNGAPAATYGIWVRATYDLGQSGSRVFWDAATNTETVASTDTRAISGWRAVKSVAQPDARYVQVGTAVWDGAVFTSGGSFGVDLFEGSLNVAGVETTPAWGDGANDRLTNRWLHGVKGFVPFAAAIRRMLSDILGAPWFSVPAISLVDTKAHVDQSTDPHTSSPTYTGTTTMSGTALVTGTLDVDGPWDFDQQGSFQNGMMLPASLGVADLPQFHADVTSGFATLRNKSWLDGYTDADDAKTTVHNSGKSVAVLQTAGTTTEQIYFDITNLFASGAAASGAYLTSLLVYAKQASGMTSSYVTMTVFLYSRAWASDSETLHFSQTYAHSAIPSSLGFLDLTAQITALSDSDRTISAGKVYTVRIQLKNEAGTADSASLYSIAVGAREKYLQP